MTLPKRVRPTDAGEAVGLLLQLAAFLVGLTGCLAGSVAAVLFAGLLYWMGRDVEQEVVNAAGPRWRFSDVNVN